MTLPMKLYRKHMIIILAHPQEALIQDEARATHFQAAEVFVKFQQK